MKNMEKQIGVSKTQNPGSRLPLNPKPEIARPAPPPKEGSRYTIKLANGKVIPGVLYENGMFWKKRIGPNQGHTWPAVEWRSEKAEGNMGEIEVRG